MIQGTTPTHVFVLPFDVSTVARLQITYAQQGTIRLQKTEKDCAMSGNEVSVRLTQLETLAFRAGTEVQVQVRVLTPSGDALASGIASVPVVRILAEDVIA